MPKHAHARVNTGILCASTPVAVRSDSQQLPSVGQGIEDHQRTTTRASSVVRTALRLTLPIALAGVFAPFDRTGTELHSSIADLFHTEWIAVGENGQLHLLQDEGHRIVLGQTSPTDGEARRRRGGDVLREETDESHIAVVQIDGRGEFDQGDVVQIEIIVVLFVHDQRLDLVSPGIGVVQVMRTDDEELVFQRRGIEIEEAVSSRENESIGDQSSTTEGQTGVRRGFLRVALPEAH